MKKSLLALAALTAFAGAASAQSAVTLFGVLDMNVRQVKNDKSLTSVSTDGIASSRLGFRGVEDLGGGMSAGFWLEAGLDGSLGSTSTTAVTNVATPVTATQSTGQAANPSVSQLFNRRSTVSLMGGFGEVRLGRDYTPDFWNHTVFDVFGTNGVGSSVNVFHGPTSGFNSASTVVRANNTVGYFLPGGLGGLYGQVQMSASENVGGNKATSFRIGYAAGPLNVAFANGTTEGAFSKGGDWKRTNVGGSYAMGNLTAMAQWTGSKASGGADAGKKLTLWNVGAQYVMGATALKASYTNSDSSGAGTDTKDATQFAAGFVHDLSKRTAVYGTFSRINNDAGANYSSESRAVLSNGNNSNAYEVGVKHSF